MNNLLIVENHPAMRRLIKSVVEDLAVTVHECADGREALAAYEEWRPEWILMDVEIGEKDGLTATREIIEANPDAKVLILTENGTERLREEARQAGACGYILKENLLMIRKIIH